MRDCLMKWNRPTYIQYKYIHVIRKYTHVYVYTYILLVSGICIWPEILFYYYDIFIIPYVNVHVYNCKRNLKQYLMLEDHIFILHYETTAKNSGAI